MRTLVRLLLIGWIASACSGQDSLATVSQPAATQTEADISSPTVPPATSTPVPPSPTPLPPVISVDTVGDLSDVLTFGEGIVRGLAFSPDGTVLAAAEGNPENSIGIIQLYEAATGVSRGTLEHTSGVWGLGFSPDGRFLVTAGRDHTAIIWDWPGGAPLHILDFPNEVVSVAFSPDSRTLAVGGVDEPPGSPLGDATIWTYAVDTWEPQLELAEFWNIPAIAFSPDGSTIVGGGTSRNARIWRASDGELQHILYHPAQVGSIAISSDGSTIATALCEESDAAHRCIRGAVWLWDLSTGRLIETLSDFPAGVGQVAYSVDGSLLFAATSDGALRALSTSDYQTVFEAAGPEGVRWLALSADGRYVATAVSRQIDLWRIGR